MNPMSLGSFSSLTLPEGIRQLWRLRDVGEKLDTSQSMTYLDFRFRGGPLVGDKEARL
jgi:hypothetical protein